MRGIPVRFWVLSAVLVGLNLGAWVWVRQSLRHQALATQQTLKVIGTFPQQQVDETDRLSIVFSGPAVDSDKVGKVEEAPLFKVSPEVAGEWKWASKERLDFVLNDPLPAGKIFNIEPSSELEVQLGKAVQLSGEIEFRTRALEIARCNILSSTRDEVQFELVFNQEVEPGALLRHLKVQESLPVAAAVDRPGQSTATPESPFSNLNPSCLTTKPSHRFILRCNRPQRRTLDVIVAAELKGHQGELPLGNIATRNLTLSQTFAHLRTEVSPPGTELILPVRLYFSEELDREQKLPPITVEPPIENLSSRIDHENWGRATLLLEGKFHPGRNYQVQVGKTLLSANGQTLEADVKTPLTIPEREPSVNFAQGRGILSPQGNLALDVKTVNVGQLRFRATRIHANNLVQHLQYRPTTMIGRTTVEKTISLPGDHSQPQTSILELRKLLNDQNPLGIYEIEARATDENWRRDQATVTVTDLALVTKREADGVWVWVSSLKSAQPVAGVKVSVISSTNQTLASGQSGADGVVRLAVSPQHPDGPPWVVMAEHGSDLAYLMLDHRQWVVDDVDQSGRPHPGAYDVLLYTERGVYRPGDTLHVTGLIRDAQGGIPPSFPLAIKVRRPDGRTAATITATPEADKQGTFHFEFPTRDDSQTGRYEFTVTLPGAKEVLGETTALVEAFVPARIEVIAEPTSPRFGPQDKATVKVRARYLFGQPAADLPLTVRGSYQLIPLASKSASDFNFAVESTAGRTNIQLPEIKLDDQGTSLVELPVPPVAPLGIWKAVLTATVTEPGGRSISQTTSVLWDTADRHIGLKVGSLLPVATATPIDFVQLSGTDAPAAPGSIQFILERIEYDTVLRQVGEHYQWVSNERFVPVSDQKVAQESIQNAKGQVTITCPVPASYRLRAIDFLSSRVTVAYLYASSQADETSSIALTRPERLELVLDQAKYKPGMPAKVVVKSPFAGTLLLSLESDRVLEHRVIAMKENSTTLEIPIPANLRGGAFVTAAVVRGIDPEDKSWLPHRAFGMARIITDHADHNLPLQIQSPSRIEPGQSLTVSVQTTKPESGKPIPMVHLWAVDEGILLTTRYPTPNLLQHFLGQRKLGVTTEDVYAALLPDHQRPVDWSRIGGDGEGHEIDSQRRSLVPPKKIDMAVLWRGFVPVDAEGHAQFDFSLPQFTGELRLMAVVVDGDRYGSTQQPVTVTSPLLLEANWPRFVAPGDEFSVPVKLFNSTAEPLSVQLNLKVDGPITVTLPAETADIPVGPQSPKTVWLPVKANGMGTASVELKGVARVSAEAVLSSQQVAQLPVRPGTTLHSESFVYRVHAGTPIEIPANEHFEPGTSHAEVSIHSVPVLEFLPAADALLHYPYGCVEQTSSRLWALLVAKEILQQQQATGGREKVIHDMIESGIGRLWAMQTRSGGLGYWPGEYEPDAWGTAYAAEVLAEAAQQGHAVDSQFREDLVDYLKAVLHGRNGQTISLQTKAQICLALAKFQHAEEGWMTRLTEQVRELDMSSRADLALAWNTVGRKDRALAVLIDDTLTRAAPASFDGRITSPTQQTAVLLNALLELDRGHAWVPGLVQKLLDARNFGSWGNTAENATALRALIRYRAAPLEPANYSGTLTDGTSKFPFQHVHPAYWIVPNQAGPLKLESAGQGQFFVNVTTTGLQKAQAASTYDRHLEVRRIWTDREGKPIDPAQIKVGDLVNVAVTLKTLPNSELHYVQNVAVVDALPGGFEVENPRLATSATQAGEESKVTYQADHVEFLDDRVVLFSTSTLEQRTFNYSLRAVATGHFVSPPIQASCMYSTDYASVNGGGKVVIRK